MVLLENTLAQLYSKMENHHHNHHNHTNHDHDQPEQLSASLQDFRSEVSKFIAQLALDLKSGSEILLSLSWTEKCFWLLPFTNKAFAKLVVDINYPFSTWEVDSVEGYLSYSLCLLELFNSVSSSLSHLGHARLSLSHGLSVLEDSPSLATKHIKAIQPSIFNSNLAKEMNTESDKEKNFSGKELVVHEAVKEMESIGFFVCGILLSGLCSNGDPYMELRKRANGFDGSLVFTLDSKISEKLMEKIPVFKELKEINDDVAEMLVASDEVKHEAAKGLKAKLQVFEKICDVITSEVNDMFNKVMNQRTELIDCLRLKKRPQKFVA